MPCQRCQSERVALINAKCADQCYFEVQEKGLLIERSGYPPILEGLADYKFIHIEVCLDCGQLQGTFPIAPSTVREACGMPSEDE
jgi:hypothetical protein